MRHTLDFEKTISDLQDKISKLKDSGSDKTSLVEVNEQIEEIKIKIDKKLNDIYKKLTPWHKLQVARHPERPHFLDYVKTLFQDFEPCLIIRMCVPNYWMPMQLKMSLK